VGIDACDLVGGQAMTDDSYLLVSERELIMQMIEEQRAVNNRLFMKMWRLCFEVAPERAKEIQREIRAGDLRISELNAKLCE
jgi:putative heme degradation protein